MSQKTLNKVNASGHTILGMTAVEWLVLVGLSATLGFVGGQAIEKRQTKMLLDQRHEVNDIHSTIDTVYWNVCYHDFAERPMGCNNIPPELRRINTSPDLRLPR